MGERTCAGCGASIIPGQRERRKRKWCSEACRVRVFRGRNPEYVRRMRTASARKHRETYVPIRHALTCVICGVSFMHKCRTKKYCTDTCRWRAHSTARRARRRGVERGPVDVAEVFNRDGWICGVCELPVDRRLRYPDEMSASLDHVVPLVLGGAHSMSNVQLAHLCCNKRKGDRIAA